MISIEPIYEMTQQELNLIKFIRGLGFGTVEISVQDGTPTLVKKAVQTIKL